MTSPAAPTSASGPRFGLSCALATPFAADGRLDSDALVAHARSRLAAGCSSVTLFGSTGEGPSVGAPDRAQVLHAFARSGLDVPRQVILMLAATAADDVLAQVATARSFGLRRFLLPPPYYFKGLGEPGLEAWLNRVLSPLAGDDVEFLLYNLPSVTAVQLPLPLVARLAAAYPRILRGVKDSSGDWSYSGPLLAQLAGRLAILIGDERHLARAVRAGGQGAISGCANFMAEAMLPLALDGRDDPRMTPVVEALLRYPVVPAVKAVLAHVTGVDMWRNTAPPLARLADADCHALAAAYDAAMRLA